MTLRKRRRRMARLRRKRRAMKTMKAMKARREMRRRWRKRRKRMKETGLVGLHFDSPTSKKYCTCYSVYTALSGLFDSTSQRPRFYSVSAHSSSSLTSPAKPRTKCSTPCGSGRPQLDSPRTPSSAARHTRHGEPAGRRARTTAPRASNVYVYVLGTVKVIGDSCIFENPVTFTPRGRPGTFAANG